MLKFKINRYLELRLENGKTNIYINNKLFRQCKYLLLKIPFGKNKGSELINSIDEVAETFDSRIEFQNINDVISISPEVQFWGHCSNLQVWYENNYNTNLLHSNLAFPLLKKLSEIGDFVAKKVIKDEIAKRFEAGHLSSIIFLLDNDYFDYLTKEELDCLFSQSSTNLTMNLLHQLEIFLADPLFCYGKITNMLDIISSFTLKYNINYLFQLIETLPEKLRGIFIKKSILYFNYIEFKDYKISYGRFYFFFEKFLKYVYRKYPQYYKTLELLSSGFMDASISLDDKLSYGTVLF